MLNFKPTFNRSFIKIVGGLGQSLARVKIWGDSTP